METSHSVNIEQRKRVTATAIESVDAFSDKQIILSSPAGRIIITGSNMKIVAFSKSGGNFSATGEINSVRYVAKGLIKRLFK